MAVKLNTPQQQIDLYHALCQSIATVKGSTVGTMPVENLEHAYDTAKNASRLATDKWWADHVNCLGL